MNAGQLRWMIDFLRDKGARLELRNHWRTAPPIAWGPPSRRSPMQWRWSR